VPTAASLLVAIGCRSKVMAVIGAITGRVITTLPIGNQMDTYRIPLLER
jgi:hypothetical protein